MDGNDINVDSVFSFTIATEITNYFECKTIDKHRKRYDWPK